MQEAFLHYLWKLQKFTTNELLTVNGESITVKNTGQHNTNSGPDFFNSQLIINGQLWAGNVEVHIKSSDWYVHGHEKDTAYDNVILHVVWEHDTDIYRADNSLLETLILKPYIADSVISNYQSLLLNNKHWINCESQFPEVDDFMLANWLERLYIERLERKSNDIENLLRSSHNDWESTLFRMLAKNFGLKVNGDAFLSLANSIDFLMFRKVRNNLKDLEALFLGQAGLLSDDIEDSYYKELQSSFNYMSKKFNLDSKGVLPVQFFRLRPPNFPTIRLAQLATLYHTHANVFSELVKCEDKKAFYKFFEINTSSFWDTHYNFTSTSKPFKKRLTKPFIDLLIINTMIPMKFAYAKSQGHSDNDKLLALIQSVDLENNTITDRFLNIRSFETSALVSQSLVQLKTNYCDKNKCVQCAIGNTLILKN